MDLRIVFWMFQRNYLYESYQARQDGKGWANFCSAN